MDTSTGPAEVLTDSGRAFLKALGNPEGPQVLAAEWVGTALADWLGLRTFAIAKMEIAADDDIPLGHGRKALPGTAIAVRAEGGASWQGSKKELDASTNVADVSRFVVLDTWLLNCDRSPPAGFDRKPNYDNVYLSDEEAPAGEFLLTAFDHTHCFARGRELTSKLSAIENVKDDRLYGRFPVFDSFLEREVVDDATSRLGSLDRAFVDDLLDQIHEDWAVSRDVRISLAELICQRADFVATTVAAKLFF